MSLLNSPPSSPSFSHYSSNHTVLLEQNDDVDVDAEFSFFSTHTESFAVSADDIFYNGQIRPLFFQNNNNLSQTPPHGIRSPRLPLRSLMLQETTQPETNDELVAEGPYCLWTPPCKNKNFLSSKRWKLPHLLPRRNADAKKTTTKVAPKDSAKKFVPFLQFKF